MTVDHETTLIEFGMLCDMTLFVLSSSHSLFPLCVARMLEAKLAEAGTFKQLLDGT